MLRYLINNLGFNQAVRCVAGLTTVSCIYSFIFASPNPDHDHHEPKSWASKRTWFDTDVKTNRAFWWFTAAVAFMFFGFYPVFFNIEEVSTSVSVWRRLQLTASSGQQSLVTALATVLAFKSHLARRRTGLSRLFGCSPS